MLRALLLATLLLPACDRERPKRPAPTTDTPPAGNGVTTAPDGQAHTVFEPLEYIAYGDERSGDLEADALRGYEFAGEVGEQARVDLHLDGRTQVEVALYGPRDQAGLWGAPLVWAAGNDDLSVELEIEEAGHYFILLRLLDGPDLPYSLELSCDGGCEAPACEAVQACRLVCEQGYRYDQLDCRLCACEVPLDCRETGCPEGQRCEEGACVREARCEDECGPPEPVCGADEESYRNACTAACQGVEVAHEGPCAGDECGADRACPEGQECRGGVCEAPECRCPRERRQVCGVDGENYFNECEADCAGVAVDYRGHCLPNPCEEDADCPGDSTCEPARGVGDLRERCADPESAECPHSCSRQTRCDAETPCPEPQICHPPEEGATPTCLLSCDLARPECPPGTDCRADEALEAGQGVCLRRDEPEGCRLGADPDRDECPPGELCVERMGRGECVPEAIACESCMPGPTLVCGADGRLYASECELRCAEVEPRPLEDCAALELGCREDEDCQPVGCEEAPLCAAAPTDICIELSEDLMCLSAAGQCACNQGRCGFRPSREAAECLGDGREGGGMPPDDEGGEGGGGR